MNDYEMMNQRINQLHLQLADLTKEQLILDRTKKDIMDELLDTRRQITREDFLRVSRAQMIVNNIAPEFS